MSAEDLRRFPVRKRTTTKEKERQRALELQERQEALERARKKANRNNKKSGNKKDKRRDQIVEEITERLYCTCRKPNDPGRVMIACDGGCEDWFHADCMGLSAHEANRLEKWLCPDCRTRNRKRDPGKRGRRDRPKKIKTNQFGFTFDLSDSTESSDSEDPYFTSDDETLAPPRTQRRVKQRDVVESVVLKTEPPPSDEKMAIDTDEPQAANPEAEPQAETKTGDKVVLDAAQLAEAQVPLKPFSGDVDFTAFNQDVAKLIEEDFKPPDIDEEDEAREELYALHMQLRLEELEIQATEIETEIRVYNSGLQIAYLKTLELQELQTQTQPTVGESYITWGLPEEDRAVAWRDTVVCPSCGGHLPLASFKTHLEHCAIQQTMDALRDPKSVVNDRMQLQPPNPNAPMKFNRALLVCGYPFHRGEGPPFKKQHFCMTRRHKCADHIGWDTTWLMELVRKHYINNRRCDLLRNEINVYTQRSRMREEMIQAQLQAQQPLPGKPQGAPVPQQAVEDPSINLAQAYMQGMVPELPAQYHMMANKMDVNDAMVHQPQTQTQADVAMQAATAQFHMHSGSMIPVLPNVPPGMMNLDMAQMQSMPGSFGALNQQQMTALFSQLGPYYMDPAQLARHQMAAAQQNPQLAHLHHQQQMQHQQAHTQPAQHQQHAVQQQQAGLPQQAHQAQVQDHVHQHQPQQQPPPPTPQNQHPVAEPQPQQQQGSEVARGTSFSFPGAPEQPAAQTTNALPVANPAAPVATPQPNQDQSAVSNDASASTR